MKNRWEQVKEFHSKDFQDFVNHILLADEEINYQELVSGNPLDILKNKITQINQDPVLKKEDKL